VGVSKGGFIWDWKDQSLWTKAEDGTPYLAYGGDFGESPHDGNFSGDGVIFGDGTISPKLYEVKRCYQNIDFRAVDLATGQIELTNKFLFTNLVGYQLDWLIEKNGEMVEVGLTNIEFAPGEKKTVTLDYGLPTDSNLTDEYVLTVRFIEKNEQQWCQPGHEIAFDQFILPVESVRLNHVIEHDGNLIVEELSEQLVVSGEQFKIRFDLESGLLVSYQIGEVELIREALRPNFWRAMTDNDRGNHLDERSRIWKDADQNRRLLGFTYKQSEQTVQLSTVFVYDEINHTRVQLDYEITSTGEVNVDYRLIPGEDLPEIPEIGLMFKMDQQFEQLSWYGKGPHESYWDKQKSARIGRYKGLVSEQYVPYLKPQECGNKVGVRSAQVTNEAEVGLSIKGSPTFELNVLPYTVAELELASHSYKLPKTDHTVVRINLAQMGVGGDDSWGQRTHSDFTLFANQNYHFSFSFTGVKK